MRILLTGAAGFIGSRIATVLSAAGHDVVAIDTMLAAAHGREASLPLGCQKVDVRDADALAPVLRGIDVVCHQAAVVGAGVNAADGPFYAGNNDTGTAVLLAEMFTAGVTRLVLASSMVVYGQGRYRCAVHGEVDPAPRTRTDLDGGRYEHRCPAGGEELTWQLVSEDAALRPRSLYAASKVAQENYALAWAESVGGSVAALRYHNVYGPGMPRDTPYSGVAAIFRSALQRGEAPRVFEDGGQMRDFVHVDDVARANLAALECELPGFTAANVCSGQPIPIMEVAAILSGATAGPAPLVTGQYRSGDVRHIVADPSRAASLLGFKAAVDPRDGLREFAFAPLRGNPGDSPAGLGVSTAVIAFADYPLLARKDFTAESVLRPANLLREARRQKALPHLAVPAVTVLDPDGDIVRFLDSSGEGRRHPGWACYHTEMWTTDINGMQIGVVGMAVGAPFAVLVAEQLSASGSEVIISVTSAGRIASPGHLPSFVLIERALRDEGTSAHYLPPTRWSHLHPGLRAGLHNAFDQLPQIVVPGWSWTTDAPFRETAAAIAAAAAEGIACVEMEAAALYAYAEASGARVVCLAHITNTMAVEGEDFEKGHDNGVHDALAVVLAAAAALHRS
ncbi:WcaG Nucleoside-diphosphate-sugar epimerases [Mycobacteriaceae bacterium]